MEERENLPKFRPRARIMRTLGEELISSDSVALIELVKNSYDADATEVYIRFSAPLEVGGGAITVIDNGKGMDISTIQNAWMEPATPGKVKDNTTASGRRVLGEKGIGRFATSRLASKLKLISRKRGSSSEGYAVFDWAQFDDDEKYLDEISVVIKERSPEVVSKGGDIELVSLRSSPGADGLDESYQGTVLNMQHLKNKWDSKSFEEVQRGLSRLISPFSEFSGFKITISAPPGFEHYSSEITPPDIINYPHYKIDGALNAEGSYEFLYESLGAGEVEVLSGAFVIHPKDGWIMQEDAESIVHDENYHPPECGPLKVQLRVWDRDELGNVVQMLGGTISSVRKDLDNFAGVNIYRDGFRVMPYGEPKNDWLRLDLRRVQKPSYRLSNNQILGYVSITADNNPDLKDQSNREGLREGRAYAALHQVMMGVLSKVEDFRYREKKGTPIESKKDKKAQGGLFEPLNLSDIRDHISKQFPSDAQAKILVDNIEAEFTSRMVDIKAVVARYSGLATLGKLVDSVLHEGRQPLAMIATQATLGQEDIEDYGHLNEPKIKSVGARLSKIKDQASSMNLILKRIEPFGGRKVGKPSKLYIEKIISDSFEIFSSQLSDDFIKYEISNTTTLVSVDPYELQQVFINLIENSIYWLQLVPPNSRAIFVRVERTEPGYVVIDFSDSGPGVPEKDREYIFDAYYSTRETGAGLGLSIVGEMVSNYYDGALELLNGGDLPGASFRITLRKRV